ncbi:MAG: N-acetylneuraminate synthase family protein [Treponema sp.]|nr:N-acetylneuraminate synthase family protein [Treponema sp.]
MSLIIAEIGTAHGGSLEKAKELVDAAAGAGADVIKFQWVYADEILHPNTGFVELPGGKIRLYDRFKQLECLPDFYRQMIGYVHKAGCKFCCSPFGLRSLDELIELKPDYVKVASPELNHFPMLKRLAEYRERLGAGSVPVILSSGVSKLSDIEKAIEIVGTDNVSLLHCITSYPAPESEYNLKVIGTLAGQFGIECGVSDHSLDPILVPCLSIACGGTVIEKHICLSKKDSGLDDPVALEPEQFAMMVHCVHQTEATFRHYGNEVGFERVLDQLSEQFRHERVLEVLGNGIKKLAPAEEANYGRTNRSLHYMHDMKVGDVIRAEDIGVLRTEKILTPGLTPDWLDRVVGAKLVCDVESGQGVKEEEISR